MHLVCRLESEGWQGNYNKILEAHKKCGCFGPKKIQETNIMFWNWNIKFLFLVFSLFLPCSLFFIHTFDYHWSNKAEECTYQ